MQLYRITLQLNGHFVTALKGDTLFGQFCWAYREKFGCMKLEQDVLSGYTEQQPKIIFSDAIPSGYFNLPKYPLNNFGINYDAKRRKELKSKKLIKQEYIFSDKNASLKEIWLNTVNLPDNDAKVVSAKEANLPMKHEFIQTHNTINRLIDSTTAGDAFAPYDVSNHTYLSLDDKQKLIKPEVLVDVFVLLESAIKIETVKEVLNNIGLTGFGADASIGKGKFEVKNYQTVLFPLAKNSAFSLSPAVPVSTNAKIINAYYDLFTRFGRHGNMMAHCKQIFKKPVVMMDSGATVLFDGMAPQFFGNGLINGKNDEHEAFLQAYSILIPLRVE